MSDGGALKRGRRIEGLDALRGLAALVVFNSHCVLVLAEPHRWLAAMLRSPLSPLLLGGHEAVLFFFMLSGFVLYLPYGRGLQRRPYLPYLVKRVCRIYLPYLAGVGFVAGAYALFFRGRPLPGISIYFSWAPMSRGEFWRLLGQHVAFLGSFHRERWNGSTWTLAEEMRISVIFPALAALLARVGWRWMMLIAAGCSLVVAFGITIVHHHFPLVTLHYASIFAVGAILASQREQLVARWRRSGRMGQSAMALASVLVLSYGPTTLGTALGAGSRTGWIAEELMDWVVVLPLAAVLVSAFSETWFTRMLEQRHFQWLGRVSYSFYLLHVPCLYLVIEVLWGRVPAVVVFAVALSLTLGLASIFYRWVELPSIALGASLARRAGGPQPTVAGSAATLKA